MSKLFRILMLAPTPYFSDRGCHVRIYEEAKALTSRGHQVLIVTYHLGRSPGDIPVVRIPNIPWYKKSAAGPSWHKPYLDILLLYKALVAAKKFNPDLIHAHLHEGAFLAAIAKRSFKKPILFDCQGSLSGELLDHAFMKRGGRLHKVFEKLESWITHQVDHIVTSSTSTNEWIKKQFKDVSSKVTSLVDAVDTEDFSLRPKNKDLIERLGLPAGKHVLVYLGALTKYQGVDLMLEAIQKLSNKRQDFHLLMMGYPENEYRRKVSFMNLNEFVTLTGQINYAMAADYLCLGDIALSPKLSETEANGKVLNYMACGLPCVVFDNAINRELLGEHGVYVSSMNPSAYAKSIETLMDHLERRHQLALNCRQFAEDHHSWHSRILDLEKVYHTIC